MPLCRVHFAVYRQQVLSELTPHATLHLQCDVSLTTACETVAQRSRRQLLHRLPIGDDWTEHHARVVAE